MPFNNLNILKRVELLNFLNVLTCLKHIKQFNTFKPFKPFKQFKTPPPPPPPPPPAPPRTQGPVAASARNFVYNNHEEKKQWGGRAGRGGGCKRGGEHSRREIHLVPPASALPTIGSGVVPLARAPPLAMEWTYGACEGCGVVGGGCERVPTGYRVRSTRWTAVTIRGNQRRA